MNRMNPAKEHNHPFEFSVRIKTCLFLFSLLLGHPICAQGQVTGDATISLVDAGVSCNGYARLVDIYIDLTDLLGDTGEPGLNSFVLCFNLDPTDVFASAKAGDDPVLDWQFMNTDQGLVDTSGVLRLVGWVADMEAPKQNYHVARFILSGEAGDVSISFDNNTSSLGSRIAGGGGPSSISFNAPQPLVVTIPQNFILNINDAVASWLQNAPLYDLALESGNINILDLVQLCNCGA